MLVFIIISSEDLKQGLLGTSKQGKRNHPTKIVKIFGIFENGSGCLDRAFNQIDPDTGEPMYDWVDDWQENEDLSPEVKEEVKVKCSEIVSSEVIDAIHWDHIHCRDGPDNSIHELYGDW